MPPDVSDGTEIDPVRRLFNGDPLMRSLGAELSTIGDGEIEAVLAVTPSLLQHDGFVHAGALTAVLDTACGAAVATRVPGLRILSIDLSVHLLRPAVGDQIRVNAHVVRVGSSIAVARGEARTFVTGGWLTCTLMTATLALRH